MAVVEARFKFLARLDRFVAEKPFFVTTAADIEFDPAKHTNIEHEIKSVKVHDIRGRQSQFSIALSGFQVIDHTPKLLELETLDHVAAYKQETQEVLKNLFQAEHAITFDLRIRKNERVPNAVLDLNNPLDIDSPVKEAHNDYTFTSGPIVVKRELIGRGLERYLRPGYRFRIVNFWRSILPVVRDAPLAFCDFRTVQSEDTVVVDRIRPDRTGEIFHFHFNEKQKWYYLDSMTSEEPVAFVTYDTAAGSHARFCPHVSFTPDSTDNSVPPRLSVETRSIIITPI
ncbi:hypothetical protein B0T17DRAFT_543702 [Bombardia bombarda]|uniref:Methyltransferase n=1 Tax=Bombardia bombarda TaxID=252184 RepID=A0AA39WD06_9PEZI|nr:hypothetical protein B0T17DRAFT_543702 [Bombardia bombarda]